MNICVLGIDNIGEEYFNTRHNTGFILLDQFAKKHKLEFLLKKYGHIAHWQFRSHNFYFLKPTTFVNNSGLALSYWMEKLKVDLKNVLVIVDDLNLDVGEIKFRSSGSSGGHNGLKNIELNLDSQEYKRLRVGIGKNFSKEAQKDFVVSKFSDEELTKILDLQDIVEAVILAFAEQNESVRLKIINDAIAKFKS